MYIPASRGEPFCSWFYRAPLCWAELRQGQHRRLLWCIHRQTLINSLCEWLQKSSPAAGNGFPFDWTDVWIPPSAAHYPSRTHTPLLESGQPAIINCITKRFHIALFHENISIYLAGVGGHHNSKGGSETSPCWPPPFRQPLLGAYIGWTNYL